MEQTVAKTSALQIAAPRTLKKVPDYLVKDEIDGKRFYYVFSENNP